jgi:hypothetical protein
LVEAAEAITRLTKERHMVYKLEYKAAQFLMVTKTFCSTYYLFYGPSCHLDVVCDSFNDLLYGGDTQVPGAGGTIPRRSYFQQKIYNSKTTTVRYLPSANSVFLCSLSYTDDQDAVLFAITLRESLA